ncbi:MAG: sigma 54-interacting transcriptional regulator [Myxococcota bacterium]|nr:sigma 54-interacting transcriptional regulator [Myxococcota bacterium]
MDKPRVLVIDDGTSYAEIIATRMPELALVPLPPPHEGGRIADGPAALEFLKKKRSAVDVVLLDMHFDVPDERLLDLEEATSPRRKRRFQGLAILREIHKAHCDLPVVLLTAAPDLSLADVKVDLGPQSLTYLLGSDDIDALRIRLHAAYHESKEVQIQDSGDVMWGSSPQMRAVRRRLSVLARGRMPIILEGETGTGKSYLAERYIHDLSGRSGPFLVCDLSAVPTELIPAHLFGAVRGAYTGSVADRKGLFELANHGTLFIDEVQNIPLDVQRQLLLVLQDSRVRPLGAAKQLEVDVKVIAASNEPLDAAVAKGMFRPDLYMRLSPATRVRLLPLRERREDLEYLARSFIERACDEPEVEELRCQVAQAVGLPAMAKAKVRIGREKAPSGQRGVLELVIVEPSWQQLEQHGWPGNIRELEMVMRNIAVFTLVAAMDAIRQGVPLESPRLQVDPALIGELLSGSTRLMSEGEEPRESAFDSRDPRRLEIELEAAPSLNAVANVVERQYFLHLYRNYRGDFAQMAVVLLGDASKHRAVRLRFNQLGLKVREL